MSIDFFFLNNYIIPIFISLLYLVFFLYFMITKSVKAKSYNYFAFFLISTCTFYFTWPIQILFGPQPYPLIINNIRLYLFCSVTFPMITFFSYTIGNGLSRMKKIIIILTGQSLGIIYGIFKTLGTEYSYILYCNDFFTAYDSLTLSSQKHYYGKETTTIIQLISGFLLLLLAIQFLIRIKKKGGKKIITNKLFWYFLGILILGVSLMIGSTFSQTKIFHFGSLICTVCIGRGILIDYHELKSKFQKILPILKDNFLHHVAYFPSFHSDIFHSLELLEKNHLLDTFIVLRIYFKKYYQNYQQRKLEILDSTRESIGKILKEKFGEGDFLILQLSQSTFGLAVSGYWLSRNNNTALNQLLFTFKEKLLRSNKFSISIGVGKTYQNLEDLRNSYQEALKALAYAEKQGYNHITYYRDLENTEKNEFPYPEKERDHLLSSIKMGNINEVEESFELFFKKLLLFTGSSETMIRIHFLELYSMLMNISSSDEIQIEKFYELDNMYHSGFPFCQNQTKIIEFLKKNIYKITANISQSKNTKNIKVMSKAKNFIENHYQDPLTASEVAENISISPSHFLHQFKKETNYTFIEYLTKVRMDNAKNLLLNSNLNISEIAYHVGFNDSNYFSTVFKNNIRITPKEYRKINRNSSG
ncbi:MAG: helix-turn-helix domain-containing protein [Spirochaetes bacterium]|nr:helix-turn-helix domain-containing protein [Spirochaetota bacterium]